MPPVPAALSALTTPAFNCSGLFGVDGVRINVTCAVAYRGQLDLVPDFMSLVAHPMLGKGGATLDLTLSQVNSSTPMDWVVLMDGGLQLRPGSNIPTLGVQGEFMAQGVSTLSLATSTTWAPLAGVLDGLVVPSVTGTFTLSSEDGSVSVAVASAPVSMVVAHGLLELNDVSMSIEVPPFLPSANMTLPDVRVSMAGSAQVGGANGFGVSLTGSLDTAESTVKTSPCCSIRA